MILSRGLKEVGNDHAGVWGRMFGAEGIAVKGPAGTWHLQGPIRRWMDSEWSKWGSWVQEEERLRGGYMGTRIRSDTEWDGTPFGGDLDRGGTWTNIFSKHHFASSEKWLWGKGTSRQIGDEATPGKRWWFCQNGLRAVVRWGSLCPLIPLTVTPFSGPGNFSNYLCGLGGSLHPLGSSLASFIKWCQTVISAQPHSQGTFEN